MRRVVLFLVFLLVGSSVSLGPGAARAFELATNGWGENLRWASFPVAYRVGPSEVNRQSRLRLVRRGFEAWGLPARSAVAFSYQGVVDEAFDSGDGISSAVVLETGPWPPELGDAQTIAGATLHLTEAGTATLVEVDIGLNAVVFRWADETAVNDALDLWSVTTHEVGHGLGLDHVCDGPGPIACSGAGPALLEAAMFPAASPGDVSRRAPADDDLNGLEALYGIGAGGAPDASLTRASCPLSITAGSGGASSASVAQVVAVHSQSGARVALGRPDASTGVVPIDLLSGAGVATGAWDLSLLGPEGKERTYFAFLTLPESCEVPPPPGCDCAVGGRPSLAGGALLLVVVLGLGLGLGLRGRSRSFAGGHRK